MSLLNVWISPGRALVAVDTAVDAMNPADRQIARIEASKLFYFPHCQMAMGCRGQQVFATDVFRAVHLSAHETVSLDVIERAFPGDLNGMLAVHAHMMKQHGLDVSHTFETELAFVGYSKRRGCMAGIAYAIRPGEREFTAAEIQPWRIGPDPGMENPPVEALDDPAVMELIARQQVKRARQLLGGNPPIGGHLLLAELTPDSFSMRQIAVLS